LESADVAALEDQLKVTVNIGKIVITKGYDNERKWQLEVDEKEVAGCLVKSAQLPQEEGGQLAGTQTVAELVAALEAHKTGSPAWTNFLLTVKQRFPNNDLKKALAATLEGRLPHFLYFPEYQKMPGEVALNEVLGKKSNSAGLEMKHRMFLALMDLVGTNPDDINSLTKFEPLIAKLEAISIRLSEEIFEYWSQNNYLSVEFKFDMGRPNDPAPFNSGWVFRTRIKNNRHGVSVNFDQRSSGFIWFFSFLVWFSQVQRNYGENLIILLDEPALNLHAMAQADWLRYISERLRPKYQVVYTTHSPFMVDADNLLDARTVEDMVSGNKVLGTKVGDRVLSSDADTLFPLQAALGYDITQTLFVGKHTLLVEGPGDLLYLKWFSEQLRKEKRAHLDARWVISPAGGIDKIASFVTLFSACKLNVAVFTDIHKGQKQRLKNLRESKLLKDGHVFSADMYCGQEEADIEDLLGRPFYSHLVTKCYGLDKAHALPDTKPLGALGRVVEEVERHFAALPEKYAEFDHYGPALYLVEEGQNLRGELAKYPQTLSAFERLFTDLNGLLPKT